MPLAERVIRYVRMHGAAYTLRRAGEMFRERALRSYDRQCRRSDPSGEELARQRGSQPQAGLISVAIPAYNTRPVFLRELTDSLTAQTYENWEAVIFDGGSTDAEAVAAMDSLTDSRIRVVHSPVNAGISGNTNAAIRLCRGDYVALCDHDDTLTPDALWHVAHAISREHPDMLYSDEDKLTEDGRIRTDPHRKPDFSPDNLRSGNYVCHLTVIRRALLEELGGLRPDFDGSQDHDLVLRVTERTQRICHIPRVLYHWRTVGASMSHQRLAQCQDAAARAVTEHMRRIGYPGACTVEDGVLRLRYEVNKALSLRVIHVPQGERYAWMNQAAASAEEDVLLFVDSSVTKLSDGVEQELLMYAQRDDVGAVTPMLTDARGRVTHAGFALTAEDVICRNAGLPYHAGGWHGMNRTSHNVAAVSAACLMIRRDHFVPFDESWQDGLGAVDWCLRLAQQGLRCVYTPHARAVCTDAALLRRWSELARLRSAWPEWRDPCSGFTHSPSSGAMLGTKEEI
ncbi:MAG: glycosyltransferase [Clostridia bacterium]|nr:glycosyltransferase [Clostridia bacterium]